MDHDLEIVDRTTIDAIRSHRDVPIVRDGLATGGPPLDRRTRGGVDA